MSKTNSRRLANTPQPADILSAANEVLEHANLSAVDHESCTIPLELLSSITSQGHDVLSAWLSKHAPKHIIELFDNVECLAIVKAYAERHDGFVMRWMNKELTDLTVSVVNFGENHGPL